MTSILHAIPPRERVVIAGIVRAVVSHTGVSAETLESRLRTARAARARHLCMALIRECSALSLAEIGGLFGRGHDTVIHGIKAAQRAISADPETARAYHLILQRTIEAKQRAHQQQPDHHALKK